MCTWSVRGKKKKKILAKTCAHPTTEKELSRHEWLKSLYSSDACVLNSLCVKQ